MKEELNESVKLPTAFLWQLVVSGKNGKGKNTLYSVEQLRIYAQKIFPNLRCSFPILDYVRDGLLRPKILFLYRELRACDTEAGAIEKFGTELPIETHPEIIYV